ncbi:MAG: hypothetical protein JO189_11650 [Deltaproteobacteria bacterium]|nr:hypothetical protein [Deltaproteobacteria bacterium]
MSEATVSAATDQVVDAQQGISAPTLVENIKERPIVSLGVAGLLGFVFGGGISSRTGAATLMLIARIWLRQAATNAFASAMSNYGTGKRNGSS